MACWDPNLFKLNADGVYTFNWESFPVCGPQNFGAIGDCEPFNSLRYDFSSSCFWGEPVACQIPPVTQVGIAAVNYTSDSPSGLDQTGGVNAFEERSTVSYGFTNPHCYPLLVTASFCTPSVWSRFWHDSEISSTSWRYTARLDGTVIRRARFHTHELRPGAGDAGILNSQATGGETFTYTFQVPAFGTFLYEVLTEYSLNDQYPDEGGRPSTLFVDDDILQVSAIAVKEC